GSFSGGGTNDGLPFRVWRNATMCTVSSGDRMPLGPQGGMVGFARNRRASQTKSKRYRSGRRRSPMTERSGPTLPAGQTSSPGNKWQPVQGAFSRDLNNSRPRRGSPLTAGMGIRFGGGNFLVSL